MAALPAVFEPSPTPGHYTPRATSHVGLTKYEYAEAEWFARGETSDGESYLSTVLVRLPEDSSQFSGIVLVEPLHLQGFGPLWIYSADYLMRSGHGYALVTCQRDTLDDHLRGHDEERYAALHIPAPDVPPLYKEGLTEDHERLTQMWDLIEARNAACSTILAQVGLAIAEGKGPFANTQHVILGGHSETGFVTTKYIHDEHGSQRRTDGTSVYSGYFPSGYPTAAFRGIEVPLVQTISDADVCHPSRSFSRGYDDRVYRRNDSDDASDQFRLYELAGAPHSGTRYPPYSSTEMWHGMSDGAIALSTRMSSHPHNELFNAALHHLVQWASAGRVPPRADRLEVTADGSLATDEHGNTRGGVRCAQMDVPTKRFLPIVPLPGDPYYSVSAELPFSLDAIEALYGGLDRYRERFEARLAELVEEGWLLPADVEEMRSDLDPGAA